MTLGTFVLGGAVAAAVAALLALAWRPSVAERLARAHSALVVAALAWLVTDLLVGTLRHAYVWDHTRTDYPWYYRLAGVWGGEEGTILLWNAVVAVALLAMISRRDALDRRASALVLAFSGALSLFALLFGLFDATSASQLSRAPLGRGLADVLVTPLMVIHPPVQFVAYGLVTVPAMYALASLWSPPHDGAWAGRAFPWARRAWLFGTLGLGLGALWAYYVLSFGGYWAWDPVETSNLLPWLALTAFLHAGKQRMRGQGHETSSLALAFGALLLTLFSTFATRSGLWVSVHAFTDPTERFEPDAAARLLAILDAHPPTQAFLALLLALALVGVALYAMRRVGGAYGRAHGVALFALAGAALLAPADLLAGLFRLGSLVTPLSVGAGSLVALVLGAPFVASYAREDGSHAKPRLDQRALLAAAVVLLTVALGVAFLLNLQVVNGPDRSVFDQRAPFVALPIASTLTVMLALAPLGRVRALALAGGALALGVVAWFLFPESRVLALAAPVALAAASAAVLKLAHVQGASSPRALRVAGIMLMLSALLGLVQWSNPPTYVRGLVLSDGASLALGFAGFALATLALLGAVAAFRARSRRLALAGAVAGALVIGYGIGALLALAALALLVPRAAEFRDGFWRHEWPRVRETGIYVVHLAVVLGLLGYAGSTYSQEREVFANVPIGAEVEVADHLVAVGAPTADAQGGLLDELRIPLRLEKEGRAVGEESLTFSWRPSAGVYDGRLDVRRALAQDVYVVPMAFHTEDGWVGADSAAGARVAAAPVDAVTFSVSVLPLMSLVWAAAWMMVLGMGLILVATRRQQA